VKRLNAKGFSVVEVILVLLLISAIGSAGYYVYQKQNESTRAPQQPDQDNQEKVYTDIQSADSAETAGWKLFEFTEGKFSFKYPDSPDWMTNSFVNEAGSEFYNKGHRVQAGVKYTDDSCDNNCGLVFYINKYVKGSEADPSKDENYAENTMMKGNNYYKLASKSYVTVSGVKGTRWEYKPADDIAASVVYYTLSDDTHSYFIDINGNGAKHKIVDITQFGEKIVSTLTFN
jgi:Tfp pilus assembly protein PilE